MSEKLKQPIELYEFETCPFCKKVREATSILALDVLTYPCPKGGTRYRPKAIKLGGKAQFPYLVDPNMGVSMYESDDIIKYIFETYGSGKVPLALRLGPLTTIGAGLGLAVRRGGGQALPSKQPDFPLDLWAYEPTPFSKPVREALCELELPYVYHNTPRGSPVRQKFYEKHGRF